MEQGILPNNIVLLKFKFFNFYDLNPKVSPAELIIIIVIIIVMAPVYLQKLPEPCFTVLLGRAELLVL